MSRPTRWSAAPPFRPVESIFARSAGNPVVLLRDLLTLRGVPSTLMALLIRIEASRCWPDEVQAQVDDRLGPFVRWLGAQSFSTAARFRWHQIAPVINRQPDLFESEVSNHENDG